MPIETSGGLFCIDDFRPDADYPREVVHMRLRFKANAFVDATYIGFVQVARILIQGRLYAPSPLVLARGILGDGPDAGAFVDCTENDRNPVYGLTLRSSAVGGSDTDLTQGQLPPGLGVLGAHRFGGGDDTTDAVLEDYPQTPLSYGDCSMSFETAVLALAGPDFPRYYGSIAWGWERIANAVSLHSPSQPPSAGGNGVSPMFRRAIECWNAASATAGAFRLLRLPVP